MALQKRVKKGGSLFKGYQLTVNSAAGDYVLNISTANSFYVNGIQLIPDNSAAGDYMTITHHDDTGAGAIASDTLGESLFNAGPGVPVGFELPALEPFAANEDLRVTYTNVGSEALTLNVYVEFLR